jgi:hypothetical protein
VKSVINMIAASTTLENICSVISISTTTTISGFLWHLIALLWPWNWLWICLIIIGWIFWEIINRNGTAHYNSENGFSPAFNRFVGSGFYLGLQTLLFLMFEKFFGPAAYCLVWPEFVHVVMFLSTGWILHISGFWPYRKLPGRRRRRR